MITEELALRLFEACHNPQADNAYAYGVNKDDIDNNIINPIELGHQPDIYQLIEKISQDGSALIWDAIIVTTQGWAAPTDVESKNKEINIPPSKHPERKRVFLICIVTAKAGISSVLKLEGEEPMFDTTGEGDLATALSNIYPKENLKYESNSGFYI